VSALVALILALTPLGAHAQTTLHVNQATGANTGTTTGALDDPFKSITFALLRLPNLGATPPVTIQVNPGTYDADPAKPSSEREIFPLSLPSGSTLTGTDVATCVISGEFNPNSPAALIRLESATNVTIKNIVLRSMNRTTGSGAVVEATSATLTIEGCSFHNNQNTTILDINTPNGGTFNLLDSNFTSNTGNYDIYISGTASGTIRGNSFSSSTGLQFGSYDGTIENNRFYCPSIAISCYTTNTAIRGNYFGPATYHIYTAGGTITGNITSNNFVDGQLVVGFSGEFADNILVRSSAQFAWGFQGNCRRNTSTGSTGSGDLLNFASFQGTIEQNFFARNSISGDILSLSVHQDNSPNDAIVANNLFLDNNSASDIRVEHDALLLNNHFKAGELTSNTAIRLGTNSETSAIRNNHVENYQTAIFEPSDFTFPITDNNFFGVTNLLNRNGNVFDDLFFAELSVSGMSDNLQITPSLQTPTQIEGGTISEPMVYDPETFETTLNIPGEAWAPNQFAGKILTLTASVRELSAIITRSTANTLVVKGNLPAVAFLDVSNFYAITSYAPTENSGLIDVGYNVPLSKDFEGKLRPQGNAHDIGAYEFPGAVNVNPPVLDPVGNRTANVGETLVITLTGSDEDEDDVLTFSTGALPAGATFDPETATFRWTVTEDLIGTYDLTFIVSDFIGLEDEETITISVEANAPPVLTTIGDKDAFTGSALNFNVTATDPNDDALAFTASQLPDGATLNEATGAFAWVPQNPGSFQVFFTVTDEGGLSDSETITITVTVPNAPPVLAAIGNQQVRVGDTLQFSVSASDIDADTIALQVSGLPSGASFDTATGAFSWTPGAASVGSVLVTFSASDGINPADSETITITILPNASPVLAPIGAKTVLVDEPLSFIISASDADGDSVSYAADNLPPGSTFGTSSGSFTWTPGAPDLGSRNVVFTALDGRGGTDSETVTLTVTDGNLPPVLSPIGDKTVEAGDTLAFTLAATDPEGGTVTFEAANVPSDATFTTGTSSFTWVPTEANVGNVTVTFTARDDANLTASESVVITVTEQAGEAVTGTVTDLFSEEPLAGVQVELFSAESGKALLETVQTDAEGHYEVRAPDSTTALVLEFSLAGYDNELLSGFRAPATVNAALLPRIPHAPEGFEARPAPLEVLLEWQPNRGYDIAGYHVYAGTSASGPFTTLNGETPVRGTRFVDASVTPLSTVYYQVTAVDDDGNESAPSETLEVLAGQLLVLLPEAGEAAGLEVRVPITLLNGTGVDPDGMLFNLIYPSEIATFKSVEHTALTRRSAFTINEVEPGVLRVLSLDSEDTDPIVGEGKILEVLFELNEGIGAECGTLLLEDFINVAGADPVPGAQFSDAFGGNIEANYNDVGQICINPDCQLGDLNGDGSVLVNDVNLMLDLVVGLTTPDDLGVPEDCFFYVADLNGDRRIDSGDAILIRRLVLGLPLNPPASEDKMAYPMAADLLNKQEGVTVALENKEVVPGELFTMDVVIDDAAALNGLQLKVSFPPVLQFEGAAKTGITADFETDIAAREENGGVALALGDVVELGTGGGSIARLTFTTRSEAPAGAAFDVRVDSTTLRGSYGENFEWFTPVRTEDGRITIGERQAQEEAVIGVSDNALDFGVRLLGAVESRTVTVSNTGSADLSGTATATGPFVVTAGSPYTVAPGASREISVEFRPTEAGVASGKLTLTGGGGAEVNLSGTGQDPSVPVAIIALSNEALNFGSVATGAEKSLTLTVSNEGNAALNGEATIDGPFAIETGGNYAVQPGESEDIVINFVPEVAGAATGTLTLTGGGGATVSLTGTGVDPASSALLEVSLEPIDFGDVSINGTTTLTLVLSNAGGVALSGEASTAAPFSVQSGGTYTIAPDEEHTLTLAFTPTVLGDATGTLTLTGGGGATIALSGTGAEASNTPVIQVSTTSISFGGVTPGSTATRQLEVSNIGGAPLTGTASTSEPFSVTDGGSYTIAPGQSATLTLEFAPDELGEASGTLTLTGGGGQTVALSGTGSEGEEPGKNPASCAASGTKQRPANMLGDLMLAVALLAGLLYAGRHHTSTQQ
jgi:hypothetical protein